MQDFVHLHVHTQYSILDGQSSVPRLVDKALKDGMRGMAITDHGNMMGIEEFFNYVRKKKADNIALLSLFLTNIKVFVCAHKPQTPVLVRLGPTKSRRTAS